MIFKYSTKINKKEKDKTVFENYSLHPKIIRRLTFLTSNLTTRPIQKICVNIVKFKSFLKNCY
jgi:hypothetical protein